MSSTAATTDRPRRDNPTIERLKSLEFWSEQAAIIGLLIAVVVFSILSSTFLTGANISDLLVSAAILVLLAIGQQFVVAVAGIDLSVGATLPLGACVIGLTVATHGWSLGPGMAAAVVVCTAVGIVNGTIIAKVDVSDFIVTLGTFGVVNGLALISVDGTSVAVNSTFLQDLALNSFVWICLVVAVVAHLAIFRTRFGLGLLATGGDRAAARSMGIRVDRRRIAAYAISGALAGLAAILLVARTGSADPALQTNLLLSSIAAVVLGGSSLFGGKASIVGTIAGALLLTALINGFTLLEISEYYQPIAVGLVVISAAVLSRFQGRTD
jgi:ribose/xylose/arabinose/galactoside ABC-type transport system permease subunit